MVRRVRKCESIYINMLLTLMLATLRTKAKYMYIEQRAEPFRYITPQICFIKISLKSIFWYLLT